MEKRVVTCASFDCQLQLNERQCSIFIIVKILQFHDVHNCNSGSSSSFSPSPYSSIQPFQRMLNVKYIELQDFFSFFLHISCHGFTFDYYWLNHDEMDEEEGVYCKREEREMSRASLRSGKKRVG